MPAIFLQEVCLKHRYIRSRDTSGIVERPERLRAINVGLATAVARIENARSNTVLPGPVVPNAADALADALSKLGIAEGASKPSAATTNAPDPTKLSDDPLTAALNKLSISSTGPSGALRDDDEANNPVVTFIRSKAAVDICTHPAVDYIHGDEDPAANPLLKLREWTNACEERLKAKESEVPAHLPQGDLYLCPQSIEAISGAVGTVCEAVDHVIERSKVVGPSETSADRRAFVAIRPPGHHCDEANPSGFCWVNNVAIAAAHAHLQHGITHVIVLDVDLHHGNGTQTIAWRINEDAYRQELEAEAVAEAGQPPKPTPLRFYYGSVHDILSYPCEDGKASLVAAASVKIAGAHGQHIENIHLETYTSMDEFWKLYEGPYSRLLGQAENFCKVTDAKPENTLVFISCGFDANELEYASMSRHGRYVPPAFYARFTRDAAAFAARCAGGKLVSVLEGGYSDRALASGALAHVAGLVSPTPFPGEDEWWSLESLVKTDGQMEKATAKKARKASQGKTEPWVERAAAIFGAIDVKPPAPPASAASQVPTPTRVLRERPPRSAAASPPVSKGKAQQKAPVLARPPAHDDSDSPLTDLSDSEPDQATRAPPAQAVEKKLPRVILHVKPPPTS
ncbi:Arginase/deacetylase [Auricularia subglabra TFB-10046 SS5]|nr:Arginase/deacetylase [Auricularia subglabra TFB-10046 SS5]